MNWTHYIHIPKNARGAESLLEDYASFEEEDFDIVELNDSEYRCAQPILMALNETLGLHIAVAEETVLDKEQAPVALEIAERFRGNAKDEGFCIVKAKIIAAFRLAVERGFPMGLDF